MMNSQQLIELDSSDLKPRPFTNKRKKKTKCKEIVKQNIVIFSISITLVVLLLISHLILSNKRKLLSINEKNIINEELSKSSYYDSIKVTKTTLEKDIKNIEDNIKYYDQKSRNIHEELKNKQAQIDLLSQRQKSLEQDHQRIEAENIELMLDVRFNRDRY